VVRGESVHSCKKCKITESKNRRRLERRRFSSGSTQAIYEENNAKEDLEICTGQRLRKIYSLYIDKEAWLKEELKGSSKPEVEEDLDEMQ